MIYCTQCGKELDDNTVFCTGCGKKLADMHDHDKHKDDIAKNDVSEHTEQSSDSLESQNMSVLNTNPDMQDQPVGFMPAAAQPAAAGAASADSLPYRGVFPNIEPNEPLPIKKDRIRKVVSPQSLSGKPRVYTFLNTGMGLIFIFVIMSVTAILGILTPTFFDYENLMTVAKQCAVYAVIAMAVVLSMRAKGIDLSIGPCIGMSAAIIAQTILMGSPLINGVLLAAAAALLLGLINGFAAAFLKAPAVIVTLITGIVTGGVTTALTQGQIFSVEFSVRVKTYAGTSPIGILVLLGVVFLFVFLYNLFSKICRPLYKRNGESALISYIIAYLASAEIAATAGFVMLVRTQTAMSALGMGYEAYIVFVFALLIASKAMDNRFAPALIALVPAAIWGILINVFTLWGVISYYQPVVYGGLVLFCLFIALICRFEKKIS